MHIVYQKYCMSRQYNNLTPSHHCQVIVNRTKIGAPLMLPTDLKFSFELSWLNMFNFVKNVKDLLREMC